MKKFRFLVLAVVVILSLTVSVFNNSAASSDALPPSSPAPSEQESAPQTPVIGKSRNYLSIDNSVLKRGDTIIVATRGISEEMADAGAFVAIYKTGADHLEYQQFFYPQAGSDTQEFHAPISSGDYEVRLYKQDYAYTDESLIEFVAFTVNAKAAIVNTNGSQTKTSDAGADYGVSGKLNGYTYSWYDGDTKTLYAFSGNRYVYTVEVGGYTALNTAGTYEVEDNSIMLTDENGYETQGEVRLGGNKLTFTGMWFDEDLILTKE